MVAGQQVGASRKRAIQRAGNGDANVPIAAPTGVLHAIAQAAVDDFDQAVHAASGVSRKLSRLSERLARAASWAL